VSEGEALASPHTHSTLSLTSSALLHIDELCTQAFLSDGSDDDKLEGWHLDSGATHHMTGFVEHFTDQNRSVWGFIKFSDESVVEICSIRFIVFMGKTGKHKLLHRVYYTRPSGTPSLASASSIRAAGEWRLTEGCSRTRTAAVAFSPMSTAGATSRLSRL
jgi:hypothetical protein